MTKQKFGSSPDHAIMQAAFVTAGYDAKQIEGAFNLGLTFSDIITLIGEYGKMVVTLAYDLYLLYSTGGLSVAAIQQLISTYGPQVAEMIKKILALAGIPHPV